MKKYLLFPLLAACALTAFAQEPAAPAAEKSDSAPTADLPADSLDITVRAAGLSTIGISATVSHVQAFRCGDRVQLLTELRYRNTSEEPVEFSYSLAEHDVSLHQRGGAVLLPAWKQDKATLAALNRSVRLAPEEETVQWFISPCYELAELPEKLALLLKGSLHTIDTTLLYIVHIQMPADVVLECVGAIKK